MRILSLLACGLVHFAVTGAVAHGNMQRTYYPFRELNGTSIVESVSQKGQLDGPKLHPGANETVFDWWYFDAVSTSSRSESITVVFYNTGEHGFLTPYQGGPLSVQISGTLKNGTIFNVFAPATDGALIESSGKSIKGDWKGTGSRFTGRNLDSRNPEYKVAINNPSLGIYGSLTLRSISPPRYPCAVDQPGVSEELIPNIYWANMQPDATAIIDLNINGAPLKFQGVGYHDKNWGAEPLQKAVKSWYWGHGRLGPYSLVWFDTVTLDGREHFSSWVTKGGKIVSQSCIPDSIVVRPWGANPEFPPPRGAGAPSGYTLRYDMGTAGVLMANFTQEAVVQDTELYKRMIGSISGGVAGGEQYNGRALCEQFQF